MTRHEVDRALGAAIHLRGGSSLVDAAYALDVFAKFSRPDTQE